MRNKSELVESEPPCFKALVQHLFPRHPHQRHRTSTSQMSLSASEILAPKHFVQQCTVNKIIVNVITNADDNDHVHDHNDEYLSQMVMVTTMAIFVFTKFSASFLSSVTATIHPQPTPIQPPSPLFVQWKTKYGGCRISH